MIETQNATLHKQKQQSSDDQIKEEQDQSSQQPKKVLVLDIDGTLYFTRPHEMDGIESQIKERTHGFFQENLSLLPDQVEEIFRKHGSVSFSGN